MAEENEEAVTAISNKGYEDVLVRQTGENKRRKISMDLEGEGQTESQNENSDSSIKVMSENGMLDNDTYNLIEQLTVENQSLWRIKNNYKNEALMDSESKKIWSLLEKDKEEAVRLLSEKLRERL